MTDPVKPSPPIKSSDPIKESDKVVTPVTPTKPEVISGTKPPTPPVTTPIESTSSIESESDSKKSEEINFLKFPEVRELTRIEFLNKVQAILNQHSSDSNSAKKAYAEIESITPD